MHLITAARLLVSCRRRRRLRAAVTIKDIQSKSPMRGEKKGQSDGNRKQQSRLGGRRERRQRKEIEKDKMASLNAWI